MTRTIGPNTDYGVIRIKLKEIMDKRGLTINQVSKMSGICYDVVKKYYYNTGYSFSLETISKLCFALKCDLKDIVVYELNEEVHN